MPRTVFRVLLLLTVILMYAMRNYGSRIPQTAFNALWYWFVLSGIFVAVYAIVAAIFAWRYPDQRRPYLADIVVSAAWVAFWITHLG